MIELRAYARAEGSMLVNLALPKLLLRVLYMGLASGFSLRWGPTN